MRSGGARSAEPSGEPDDRQLPRRWADASPSAIFAGFITVLVGFTSSAVIVIAAARALNAGDALVASWMLALCVGMAVSCIGLSLYYRAPIVTAWSTPGAALIAGLHGVALDQATAAFIAAGLAIAVCGYAGLFDRLVRRLPMPLAHAMLAGVLLRFPLAMFTATARAPALVLLMLVAYLVMRRVAARYAVLAALIVGIVVATASGTLAVPHITWALPLLVWTTPRWDLTTVIGVGIPLFAVTMASQNLPGVAVMRACGFGRVPSSPLIGGTGLLTVLLAPFGGFAFNLAAITAAIAQGPEAHPDPVRRYPAAVSAGFFYLLVGVMALSVVALINALPGVLLTAIAGLALVGVVTSALYGAVESEAHREAAVITFLVTASQMAFFGVGSAFWGLLAGLAVTGFNRFRRRQR